MAPGSNQDVSVYYIGNYTRADSTVSVSCSTVVGCTITQSSLDKAAEDVYYTNEYKEVYRNYEKWFRQEEWEWMTEGWNKRVKPRKPIIKRSILRLRGVCLDGRGWAD